MDPAKPDTPHPLPGFPRGPRVTVAPLNLHRKQAMPTYHCHRHRPITAPSILEAAGEFARRKARREFGRRGTARAIRIDSTGDGFAECSAFIGLPGPEGVSGSGVAFTVTEAP